MTDLLANGLIALVIGALGWHLIVSRRRPR